jgi:aminoglycoside/choline kinase family phosphotransferase
MGELNEKLLDNNLGHLKQKLLELDRQYFLYRDFQSRNIMIKNNALYFIDFQSGRRGALLYDLASLLYDAKADVPQKIREQLLEYYLKEVSSHVKIDTEKYRQYFWYFAVIRILQALGAYGFVGIVKGRSKFLESIPYALKNINFILNQRLQHSELGYLKNIFTELLNSNLEQENISK